MSLHYLRTTLSGLLVSAVCLVSVANATLIDRGNGKIYDSVQDITWLQDASSSSKKMILAISFFAKAVSASFN